MLPVLSAVGRCLRADIPVLLWGAPGTGKTKSLLTLAKQASAHLETLIGSTMDPADVGGLPVPDAAGNVKMAPPPWARRLQSALLQEKPAWLFLDELSCAPPSVQAALLRVVMERRAGEMDLEGIQIIAAANPADSAADGGWLSPAMRSRFCHLEWGVDVQAWTAGLLSNWESGERCQMQRVEGSQGHALVSAYISRHQEALAPGKTEGEKGIACPRTWEWIARAIPDGTKGLLSIDGQLVASGLLGAASDGLVTWARTLDLPDPEEVLLGRAKLPGRPDQAAATLTSVVAIALQERPDRPDRIKAAWKVLSKARPDQACTPGRALINAHPEWVPDEAIALGAQILGAGKVL